MKQNKTSVRISILLVSVIFCSFFLLSGCRSTSAVSGNNVSETALTARESVSQGTILHCWCWSFKTIEEKLPAIKDAGFAAVQTSPANTCLVGEGGGIDALYHADGHKNLANYSNRLVCTGAKAVGDVSLLRADDLFIYGEVLRQRSSRPAPALATAVTTNGAALKLWR